MRTSPHTTAIARIVVAAVTLVALTGCVRVHTDLTLNNDNTASGEIIFAVSDEFAESLGMTPEEVADALLTTGDGAADQGIGAGATSEEPYQEDSYTGTRYVFEATPINDTANDETLSIIREDDVFVVSGVFEDQLSDPELAGLEDPMLSSMDVRFSITFPGDVIETNGDIDGQTVTWTYTPGEDLVMEARGEATGSGLDILSTPEGGLPGWLIGLLIALSLVLVAIVVVIIVVISRSRRNQAHNDGQVPPPGASPLPQEAGTTYPQEPPAPPTSGSEPPAPPAPTPPAATVDPAHNPTPTQRPDASPTDHDKP